MEKKDSLLMLKYMISEGFNPNNYERILELLQSAPLSLSKNLKEYNPYLLSKNFWEGLQRDLPSPVAAKGMMEHMGI